MGTQRLHVAYITFSQLVVKPSNLIAYKAVSANFRMMNMSNEKKKIFITLPSQIIRSYHWRDANPNDYQKLKERQREIQQWSSFLFGKSILGVIREQTIE